MHKAGPAPEISVRLAAFKRAAFRARVDEAGAVRFFAGRGAMGRIGALIRGPLRRVGLVQVPYRIFPPEAANGTSPLLAFDVFSGTLDPYTVDAATQFEESGASERNHLPVRLNEQQARECAQHRYQRIRFQEGFFQQAGSGASLGDALRDVYLPYWIGFFGRGPRLGIRVLNAVRGAEEGSRLRHVISNWIAEEQSD